MNEHDTLHVISEVDISSHKEASFHILGLQKTN